MGGNEKHTRTNVRATIQAKYITLMVMSLLFVHVILVSSPSNIQF